MAEILSETITPWLIGTLATLAFITLFMTSRSWREMKGSPYFFLRRQAEKRLQSYMSASAILLMLAAAIAVYAWRAPIDITPRVAILTNAKPPKEEIVALMQADSVAAAETITETAVTAAEITQLPVSAAPLDAGASFSPATFELPSEYDQIEPQTELLENTQLGTIYFSTDINDQYNAVNPRRIFGEGYYTLYATFSYDDMADGMVWSWVWRHNGEVVEGGNEVWQYGDDGPGYIYFSPEEGFQYGDYSLEVWVNGELLTQSSVVMNSAAVSAGN